MVQDEEWEDVYRLAKEYAQADSMHAAIERHRRLHCGASPNSLSPAVERPVGAAGTAAAPVLSLQSSYSVQYWLSRYADALEVP